ncbi:MAG: hypothetical protein EXR31_05765 [Betaproteobacteria bacterium]|nr:hypothetical protein [Betaproteobacteria bacterium]
MKAFLVAAACGVLLALAGCSGGGQQRGLFVGHVTDKTEEDVVAKVGKPDAIDASKPNTPRWIYKKKTFDPDNQNQVDKETILIFQKDASGKFKVTQVIFS